MVVAETTLQNSSMLFGDSGSSRENNHSLIGQQHDLRQ